MSNSEDNGFTLSRCTELLFKPGTKRGIFWAAKCRRSQKNVTCYDHQFIRGCLSTESNLYVLQDCGNILDDFIIEFASFKVSFAVGFLFFSIGILTKMVDN